MLVKQTEVPGISHEDLPFECNVSVTLEGLSWALGRDNQGRAYPKDFDLSSEGGQKLYIPPINQQLLAVYKELLMKEQCILVLPGRLRICSPLPDSTSHCDQVACLSATEEHPVHSPTIFKMGTLLGLVGYVASPNAPLLFLWQSL